MSDHKITSADLRQAAYAAPTGSAERRELDAASKLAQQERLESLGDGAAAVLDLERKLAELEGERRRAVNQLRYAQAKLEEMHQALSAVLGKDTRRMGLVTCAAALSDHKHQLVKLAGHVEQAHSLEDLAGLKRIVTNLGITQPSNLAEQAALLGLRARLSA